MSALYLHHKRDEQIRKINKQKVQSRHQPQSFQGYYYKIELQRLLQTTGGEKRDLLKEEAAQDGELSDLEVGTRGKGHLGRVWV